jgi:formate--tetrahydrofolate ligase
MAHHGVKLIECNHWALGGEGAEELAKEVVNEIAHIPPDLHFVYEQEDSIWTKITKVAEKIYGANDVIAETKIRKKIKRYQDEGYGRFPVCLAKTQYSFSTDQDLRGAPSGHSVAIKDVYVSAGAEFIVVLCGHIMTMPGLPKVPAANNIDIDADNEITGLF